MHVNTPTSGTAEINGEFTIDCLEVLEKLDLSKVFGDNETKKERHQRLAVRFDQTVLTHFNVAMQQPIDRSGGYHMLMEYLCAFENELTRCGMFFGGSQPGFLDFWIYPWIVRIGVWTPEFMKNEMCRLQGWRRRMKELALTTTMDVQKASRSDLLKYAKVLRNECSESNVLRRLNSVGSTSSMGSLSS
jgi:hypothetical protein